MTSVSEMAFQHHGMFHDFLTTCSRSGSLRVRAPGENFILEESEAVDREQEYMRRLDGVRGLGSYTFDDWAMVHKAHGEELVAAKAPGTTSATFTEANRPNLSLSATLESNQQVVRLESVAGLFLKVFQGDYVSPIDLYGDLQRWTAAQTNGSADVDAFPRLQVWLEGLNSPRNRDQRPVWVTTFTSVSPLMKGRHWPARLRDALGLAHFSGSATATYPVVLLQYPLQRVFDTHRAASGWAAIPTVLDDVPGTTGINSAFFPPARSASVSGMGAAVDLDQNVNSALPEFLHARIDYRLEDFKRVALISTPVTETVVEQARARHMAHYRPQYRNNADLPASTGPHP